MNLKSGIDKQLLIYIIMLIGFMIIGIILYMDVFDLKPYYLATGFGGIVGGSITCVVCIIKCIYTKANPIRAKKFNIENDDERNVDIRNRAYVITGSLMMILYLLIMFWAILTQQQNIIDLMMLLIGSHIVILGVCSYYYKRKL